MLEPGVQSYNYREANQPGSWGKGTAKESAPLLLEQEPTYRSNLCSEAALPGEALCVWSWAEAEGLAL